MLICVIAIVSAWSDGSQYVRNVGLKADPIRSIGGTYLVQLDKQEMKKKGAIEHALNADKRWVFADQCYNVNGKSVNY